MARSLPPRPTLEALKKQAKELLQAHRHGDKSTCKTLRLIGRLAKFSDEQILSAKVGLQEVQHALALDYGFKSWSELKAHVEWSGQLSKGTGFDWVKVLGENRPNCQIVGDNLVVDRDPGEDSGFSVELGGMSWDNYRLGVDVLV